jgi:hypothetical protein
MHLDVDLCQVQEQLLLLAHALDLQNQPLLKIVTLRLLLKIINLKRGKSLDPLLVTQAARLYSDIGTCYTELGYTGKAGISFSYSNKLLQQTGSLSDSFIIKLLYSAYLANIGNVAKR